MKKALFIFTALLLFSCSKSEDSSDNTNSEKTSTDTKIDLPDWLNGTYKANAVIRGTLNLAYPKTNPYSIEFKSKNDMLIKSLSSSSPVESLQSKINSFISSGTLKSVEESYNTLPNSTDYVIKIGTIPPKPATWIDYTVFKIHKTSLTGVISIDYSYESGAYEVSSNYTLQ